MDMGLGELSRGKESMQRGKQQNFIFFKLLMIRNINTIFRNNVKTYDEYNSDSHYKISFNNNEIY